MFKVLKDFKGSPDGYTVHEYVAGQEVELVPSLAEVALKEKWVKELPKPKVDLEAERRAAEEKAAAEAAAAKAAAIADLQAKIGAAAEADKPALEAELAAFTAP